MSTMLETARELRPLIAKLAPQIEKERRLPQEILDPMHAAGMFRMFLPREIGGPELDPWTAFEVTEQLAMEDASAAWCAMILSVSAYTAAFLPEHVAREIFANQHDVLAGSVQGESSARVVKRGIVLSGRFHYASGCLHSTWLAGVTADPRHESDGPAPRLAAVIPTSQCSIVDTWQTTGLRGTSSNDWTVDEVFVPWERTFTFLPKDGSSFAAAEMYSLASLNLSGIPATAVHLGAAGGALDSFLTRIQERLRRGTPLREDAAIQRDVGRAAALVASGRALMKDATAEFWETVCSGRQPDLAQLAQMRLAKTIAVSNSIEAVDLLYEGMGSPSILDSSPVERRFRDVHAAGQHGQSSKQGFTVAGAVLMGLDPRPTPLLA